MRWIEQLIKGLKTSIVLSDTALKWHKLVTRKNNQVQIADYCLAELYGLIQKSTQVWWCTSGKTSPYKSFLNVSVSEDCLTFFFLIKKILHCKLCQTKWDNLAFINISKAHGFLGFVYLLTALQSFLGQRQWLTF